MGVTLKPWLATRKMRLASSSITCPSSPRWRPWPRPAAICFNSSKATRRKPQEAFSSAYPGNKLRLTAKTSKSKKVTKLGLSVLWKRDSALRVSLTNPELLKSPPRRRRVNFGKKRSFLKLKKAKKNPIPSHTEKFHDFYFKEEKKIPNYYYYHIGFVCHLYQTQLSVYLTKNNNNKRINKHTKTTEKHLLLDTQFVFLDIIQQFRIYNLLFHKCSPLFSTILLKKNNVLTKT